MVILIFVPVDELHELAHSFVGTVPEISHYFLLARPSFSLH
jgi:hypothetical protein